MVPNTLFCLARLGQPTGCVLSWLLVEINPVLAKSRTTANAGTAPLSLYCNQRYPDILQRITGQHS